MLTHIAIKSNYTHTALLAASTATITAVGTNIMDRQLAPLALRLTYKNGAGSIIGFEWVDDINIPVTATNALLKTVLDNSTKYRKFPKINPASLSSNVNGASHSFFLPNPPAVDFRVFFECFCLIETIQPIILASDETELTYIHK